MEVNETEEKRKNGNGKREKSSFKDPTSLLLSYGYTLGPQIGKGSYAVVQLATRQKAMYQYFAIKIINKIDAPKDFINKFLPRELEVVKRLRHENLVKFYQAIETTRRVYIIMEFVENGSLLDRIRQEEFIEEDKTRDWFKQIVEAVDYCHHKGVAHRDIKCENILLDSKFKIKLTDFGFAKANVFLKDDGSFHPSETYCGSYAYAPPEIIRGIPYNPLLADIWSMGVVLYAMLFGKLPFEASNTSKLLKQMESKLQFPKNPTVSRSGRDFVTKILTSSKTRLKMSLLRMEPWMRIDPDATSLREVKPEMVPFRIHQENQ